MNILTYCLLIYFLIGFMVALVPMMSRDVFADYRDVLLDQHPDLDGHPNLMILIMLVGVLIWVPAWPVLFMDDDPD